MSRSSSTSRARPIRARSTATRAIRPRNICCRRTSISFSFNVYLERQRDFEKYLARLQNLAEDKPLIFGEFGLDTIRKSEEQQAEVLAWHLEGVVRGGAAGTIFFAWTDEWFTGGSDITDWAFGLVTRDRQPKKAFHALQEILARRGLDDGAGEAARVIRK